MLPQVYVTTIKSLVWTCFLCIKNSGVYILTFMLYLIPSSLPFMVTLLRPPNTKAPGGKRMTSSDFVAGMAPSSDQEHLQRCLSKAWGSVISSTAVSSSTWVHLLMAIQSTGRITPYTPTSWVFPTGSTGVMYSMGIRPAFWDAAGDSFAKCFSRPHQAAPTLCLEIAVSLLPSTVTIVHHILCLMVAVSQIWTPNSPLVRIRV